MSNEQTTWERLPAIDGKHGGCLNCGVRPSQFPMDGCIGVGFGYAGVTKDGAHVFAEGEPGEPDDGWSGQHAEDAALKDPDHDWRITLDGPLSGRTYQRHGPGEWNLIEQNMGFA